MRRSKKFSAPSIIWISKGTDLIGAIKSVPNDFVFPFENSYGCMFFSSSMPGMPRGTSVG